MTTRNDPHLLVFQGLEPKNCDRAKHHDGKAVAIRATGDGSFLVAVAVNHEIWISDGQTVQKKQLKPEGSTPIAVGFWGNDILVGVTQVGAVHFWKRGNSGRFEWTNSMGWPGKAVGEIPRATIQIMESKDGSYLAVAYPGGIVALFEKDKAEPRILSCIKGELKSLAFSDLDKGKRYLAAAGKHGTDWLVWVWDISNMSSSAIVLSPDDILRKGENRKDGPRTVGLRSVYFPEVAGEDLWVAAVGQVVGENCPTIFEWLVDTKRLFEEAEKRVLRNLTCQEWEHYVGQDVDYERTRRDSPLPLDWKGKEKPPGAWEEKDA